MMVITSTWLGLALLLSLFAWFANRRFIAAILPFAAIIAALALYVPLGKPTPSKPPQGNYAVLGFDIQENVAIYILLKGADGVPTFYKLPYSNDKAGELQHGHDDAQAEGGSLQVTFGGNGDAKVGIQGTPEKVKPAE